MHEPLDLALDIIELRAYVRTKDAVDRAKSEKEMPTGRMVDLVWAIQHEKSQEERAKRARKQGQA